LSRELLEFFLLHDITFLICDTVIPRSDYSASYYGSDGDGLPLCVSLWTRYSNSAHSFCPLTPCCTKKNKLAALSSRFSVQKTFMKNGSESRESDIHTQT